MEGSPPAIPFGAQIGTPSLLHGIGAAWARGYTPRALSRSDRVLAFLALLCAGLVLFALPVLWPLPDMDLDADRTELIQEARQFLVTQGFAAENAQASVKLRINAQDLDHVEEILPREGVQDLIRDGHRLYFYEVLFKERGNRVVWRVDIHPERGILAWRRAIQDDERGEKLSVEDARKRAHVAIRDGLGLDVSQFREVSAATTNRGSRIDHVLTWRRRVSKEPRLDQRLSVSIRGGEVSFAGHELEVPAKARRAAKAAEAPRKFAEAIGFALLALGAVTAFLVFLNRLQEGKVQLKGALRWTGVVAFCLLTTSLLRQSWLFGKWETLWPRWVSDTVELLQYHVHMAWVFIVILAVIAAGDAVDRASGANRGASLWLLSAGKFGHPRVAAAAARGFAIGLVCGLVLSVVVGLEVWATGGRIDLQPRFYFLTVLNASSPALMSLLIFLPIALGEEIGYRLFLGTWLEAKTGRRWVAILVPALIYGLVHTNFSFLPPEHPWWGRAVAMASIGLVWGWAFFRYDALTVVLSHYTADLFIYNWPRLASGHGDTVAITLVILLLPLLPVAAWAVSGRMAPAASEG